MERRRLGLIGVGARGRSHLDGILTERDDVIITWICDKILTRAEEAAKYAEELRLNICHWFTVDDLVYLKRGGRISPTAAFFGNMLGIKPVLHVDNEGHLVNVQKIRGRKMAIETLAAKCNETRRSDYHRIYFKRRLS